MKNRIEQKDNECLPVRWFESFCHPNKHVRPFVTIFFFTFSLLRPILNFDSFLVFLFVFVFLSIRNKDSNFLKEKKRCDDDETLSLHKWEKKTRKCFAFC